MNDVRIHAALLDDHARQQIGLLADHPAIAGPVAIMPDAHAGAGCVIGFTGRFRDAVIPNIVGVDIGCGVAALPLPGVTAVDFPAFDRAVRTLIPLGMTARESTAQLARACPALLDEAERLCARAETEFYAVAGIGKHPPPLLQVGTLGGGNHFLELDAAADGTLWLTVHSGSRNFGKQVADHYQQLARAATARAGVQVARGMEFLPDDAGGDDYRRWAQVAQAYARLNRRAMLTLAAGHLGVAADAAAIVESVHNYLDAEDGLVRKGAIAARAGERVIIPLNMADGIVIGTGRGNAAYNCSAPHGAGRQHGRKEMLRLLDRGEYSLRQYHEAMRGVFSTSISRATFDESPFAYKPYAAIRAHLAETVTVAEILKPVYNLKAAA